MWRRPIVCLIVIGLLAVACNSTAEVADPGPEATSLPDPGPAPGSTAQPSAAEPVGIAAPPEPPPIIPVLHRAGSQRVVSVGVSIPFAVDLFAGEPLQSIELLVNGVSVDRIDYPMPATNPTHVFDWTPVGPGWTVAEVVAVGVSGAIADSTPTWLTVVADDEAGVGSGAFVLPPLDTPSDGVTIDVDSCEATINVPAVRDAGGMIIKGANPGSSRFIAIDVLPGAGGAVSVPLTGAPLLVRADSYTTEAMTASTAFVVPGAKECGGTWTGDISLDNGVLDVDNIELAYLYASTDGANWQRLPDNQGEFIERGPSGFDFSDDLGRILEPDGDLEIEGWGWHNGELVELGHGSFSGPQASPSPWTITPLILPSELTVQQERVVVDADRTFVFDIDHGSLCLGDKLQDGCIDEPALFHWQRFDQVEAGFFQISRLPFPSGTGMDPPGLLFSEMIPVDDATELFFPLDVRDRVGLGDRPMESGEIEYLDLDAMQADLSDFTTAPTSGPRRSEITFRADRFASAPNPPSHLYVRIVHFVNGRPTDTTSNTVELVVTRSGVEVIPSAQTFDKALIDEVNIDLPRSGNPKFEHCVRVIANPHGAANPAPHNLEATPIQVLYDKYYNKARTYTADGVFARGLEPGATVCSSAPEPPDKDFLDYVGDVVSFAAGAWDLFVEAWDMLQEKLVQGLVFVTGCTPKDVCTAVASTMLKVGLAAVGVPPTIPRFSDLVHAAKGELIELATAALLKEIPLCAEGLTAECQKILSETLDWVLDEVQAQASAVAFNKAIAGNYELFLNPDLDIITEPAGQMSFGFAEVTVTVPKDAVVGQYTALCSVTFEVYATGLADWREANGLIHHEVVTKRIIGPTTTGFDLSTVAPGESITVVLLPTDFDRTTHMQGAWGYGYKSQYDDMEAWRNVRGLDATMEARVDVCGTKFTQSGPRVQAFPTPADYRTPAPF